MDHCNKICAHDDYYKAPSFTKGKILEGTHSIGS
jgi:hypothetical protein